MRAIRFASFVSLGFLLLTACARPAAAQTYIWTDDHGVVHAAADPSEVPANQREKALRDAVGRRNSVTIAPAEDAAVPAAPAPSAGPEKARKPPAPTPRSFEGDAPDMNGGGTSLDANPEVTPGAKGDELKPKKFAGKGLPPPDPGFEWNCATDPEGGPPKCEQFEKRNNKRDRRAAARKAAREQLHVDDPTQEFDPDVAKKVEQRADEEFKKSTPVPTAKAPKRSASGDDEDGGNSESSDDSED